MKWNSPKGPPSVIRSIKPNLWFHIHIPKTAGSTLRQILGRNFAKSYFSAVSLLEHHKLRLTDTEEIVKNHYRWLRCYSDHRLSLDLPFDSELVDTKALAFVRNPVDQVISQYHFQRGHHRRTPEVTSMSLEEFVEKKFNRHGRISRGIQLQRLKGLDHGTSLEQIKSLLDDEKLFLFPLEEFDLACACLEKKFPNDFLSTEYLLANKGPEKGTPSSAVKDRIRELVAPDFDLHNIATWFLSTLSSTTFETPSQMESNVNNLKDRCKRFQNEVAGV